MKKAILYFVLTILIISTISSCATMGEEPQTQSSSDTSFDASEEFTSNSTDISKDENNEISETSLESSEQSATESTLTDEERQTLIDQILDMIDKLKEN